MPKLYYSTTSCGAASFIAAVAADVRIDAEQTDILSHRTSSGEDFYRVNPKGNVPALILDDGTVLNEGAAVLQWIADQVSLQILYSRWQEALNCHQNARTGSRNNRC
jgi:glutathione S-transferase